MSSHFLHFFPRSCSSEDVNVVMILRCGDSVHRVGETVYQAGDTKMTPEVSVPNHRAKFTFFNEMIIKLFTVLQTMEQAF